jgi:hypothetical protein
MQASLGQWQKERREFGRDVERRDRLKEQRESAVVEQPAEGEGEAPVDLKAFGKVIEVGKGTTGKGKKEYGKVIELKPDRDGSTRSVIDEELEKAEERAEAVSRKKREDPKGFAREKAEREAIASGNRAWGEAVEKRFKQREASIEAEARRMQAELDAARKQEERAQAAKMGGTIDEEGNFVDPEISDDPKK